MLQIHTFFGWANWTGKTPLFSSWEIRVPAGKTFGYGGATFVEHPTRRTTFYGNGLVGFSSMGGLLMPLAVVFQKDLVGSELGKRAATASPSDMVCTRVTGL